MEPAEAGVCGCLGPSWGVGPASQLPFLLITLEDIPQRRQGFWRKEIDATVDDITDECAGFLHIVQDLMSLWILNDAAVVEGLCSVSRGAKE